MAEKMQLILFGGFSGLGVYITSAFENVAFRPAACAVLTGMLIICTFMKLSDYTLSQTR